MRNLAAAGLADGFWQDALNPGEQAGSARGKMTARLLSGLGEGAGALKRYNQRMGHDDHCHFNAPAPNRTSADAGSGGKRWLNTFTLNLDDLDGWLQRLAMPAPRSASDFAVTLDLQGSKWRGAVSAF